MIIILASRTLEKMAATGSTGVRERRAASRLPVNCKRTLWMPSIYRGDQRR